MRRITIFLFLLGLLFEFAAFCGDQAKDIPPILRFIAPDYVNATAGIGILSTKKLLKAGDLGFKELSSAFLNKLMELNDPEEVSKVSVQVFKRGTARLGFSVDRAREVIPIQVEVSNGQTLEWSLESATEEVAKLEKQNLFRYSLVVFFTGALIQCIAFYLERKESRRPKKICEL